LSDLVWDGCGQGPPPEQQFMARYTVNKAAVEHAHQLVDKRRYVLNSDWGTV
jgi:hypothetical protein